MNRRLLLLAAVVVTVAGAGSDGRAAQTPVFTSRAELTVLNVVVTNRSGAYVADLPRGAFAVYEDGSARAVEFFSGQDAAATIGLLIDSSASMYGMRNLVSAAVGAFAATSNPQDEIFALTFSDRASLVLPADQPFTNDPVLLETSLRAALGARGRTAFHDAVAVALAHLDRGRHTRKVLVVVTDGADNASRATFDEVAHAAATSNTVIYTVAVVDRSGDGGRPDRLTALATLTGGTAQAPRHNHAVQQALQRIARDIRSSYIVGYMPPADGPMVRHVHVVVTAPDGSSLRARTRREYIRPED